MSMTAWIPACAGMTGQVIKQSEGKPSLTIFSLLICCARGIKIEGEI